MRKGALNRFSVVVAILSLASVVPVAYFRYKSTAPSYYVCTDSLSGTFSCYPLQLSDLDSNDTFSYDHPSNIERPAGRSPTFHISDNYLRKHYKYMAPNNHGDEVSPEAIGNEVRHLRKHLNEESMLLMKAEKRYKEDTIAFTICVCIVLPLLALMTLYILRLLVRFVLYGKGPTANAQA